MIPGNLEIILGNQEMIPGNWETIPGNQETIPRKLFGIPRPTLVNSQANILHCEQSESHLSEVVLLYTETSIII